MRPNPTVGEATELGGTDAAQRGVNMLSQEQNIVLTKAEDREQEIGGVT
jgi:hypothetical protein